VTDKKLDKLKAMLHDLNAQYPEDEYVDEVALVLEGVEECPVDVLEVLAGWGPSRINSLDLTLEITKLSDAGAEILSRWKGVEGFGTLYLTELVELSDIGAQHLLKSGTFLGVHSERLPSTAFEILSERQTIDEEDGLVIFRWLVDPRTL